MKILLYFVLIIVLCEAKHYNGHYRLESQLNSDGTQYGSIEDVKPKIIPYSALVGDNCPTGMVMFNVMCIDVDY